MIDAKNELIDEKSLLIINNSYKSADSYKSLILITSVENKKT